MMGKDSYTVIVVPQRSSQVKRYNLSTARLKAVASVFTAIFVVSAWLVYDYATVKSEVGELKELREQNQAQSEQIRSFVGKITAMESQMLKLIQFEAKLRIINNLEKPGSQEQYIGIGGP